jgi:hypothetical protein
MSERKRFSAEMLTAQQKLELRAGLAQQSGERAQAQEFARKIARAKKSGTPLWLAWVADQPLTRILDVHDVQGDVGVDTAGVETSGNAVDEALAIVRSASINDIDWTKEPLTEREQKVRAKILEAALQRPLSTSSLRVLLGSYDCKDAASDIRAAIDQAEADSTRWLENHRREAIENAVRAVDLENPN